MPDNIPTDNAVQPAPDTAGLSLDRQSPIPIPQADPNLQAPPQPGAPPQQPQVDPVAARHSALGRGLSHIAAALEGKQISYEADPNSPGNVRQVVTPRKAGGLWRDIVLGSIAGGAVGSTLPNRQSAVGGAAVGAQAGLNTLDASQGKRKEQAQQTADEYKRNQDRQHQQAQIAHDTISNLHFDSRADLFNPTQISSYNSSQANVKQLALSNGGTIPKIIVGGKDINGVADNGGPLMDSFHKNPTSVMGAPDGYHRIHFATVDTSGLTYKPGVGYVDAQGQHVDLADRTTHQLIDLPEAAWNKNVTLTARQINEVAGSPVVDSAKPDRQMSSTFGSLFGLGLKSKQDLIQAHRELHEPPKDANEAMSFKAFADATKADPNATPEDRERAEIKGAMADSFLQTKQDSEKDKPLTPEQDKLRTRELEKKLWAGTLTPDERTDLVSRQQEAKLTGVPGEMQAIVGKPPAPAQFPRGEDDPRFKVASALWGNKVKALKQSEQTAAAQIRVSAFGEIPYNVIDTKTNQMAVMTRDQLADANKANPGRYLLSTQEGVKVRGKDAALQDIHFNLDNTAQKIDAMDNLDAKTRAQLSIALRSTDPKSALSTWLTSEAGQGLSDKQQDAVIALTSLAENVMMLRSVQGLGAGSDEMRAAMTALVPSGKTPTKGYAKKQLDTLRQTLNRLEKGVPKTGGMGTSSDTTQQNGPPTPTSHIFSVGAWQKANPTGDPNAAIAAAKQAGYQVSQ